MKEKLDNEFSQRDNNNLSNKKDVSEIQSNFKTAEKSSSYTLENTENLQRKIERGNKKQIYQSIRRCSIILGG